MSILEKIFKRKGGASQDAGPDTAQEPGQGGTPAENPAADKQRMKKIKAMCAKFNETVWSSALEVMQSEMPRFVISEPDPDIPGSSIVKYVLLGFDTKIVDDFSNKADDDVGSIMTAIKSSMDCVIEEPLLAQELILMIPTARTLAALKEFEESFDLYFYAAYMQNDRNTSIETDAGGAYVRIRLSDIEEMLADDDMTIDGLISSLKGGNLAADPDDITAPETGYDDNGGDADDGIPDESSLPDEDPDGEGSGSEPGEDPDGEGSGGKPDGDPDPETKSEQGNPTHTGDETRQAVSEAVKDASKIADRVGSQKDETTDAGSKPDQGQPRESGADGGDASGAAAEAAAKMEKLKNAVQKASDDALDDSAVKNAQANINPQARMAIFDMTAMDQYVTRKYYSDDLGLEITSEPFDAMFMQSNPYVPFQELEDDAWLSGYVNNLRRDANTRLAKLHHENIMLMRERYMLIIMKHCESITKSVSTDDPNSRFGYAMKSITQLHNDDMSKIPERSEAYKRECEQAYQARMETAAKNAAAAARAQFEHAHRAEHERELKEIETDLRNNIESEYVASVENLKTERRNEAKRQLDAGISEALKLCSDEYTKMLAMERKEYVRLQAVITNFQNDNMVAEQARVMALAEDQRRENEVVKVRREYDSKYELANREFESKLAAAKADMERAGLEHNNYIAELREQHEKMMQGLRDAQREQLAHKDTEIQTLQSQLDTANAQIKTLTEKYVELDEKAGQKYAGQIDMLRGERDAWTERSEQVERLHKYTDKIKLTAMIVAVVAALGLGIIFGCAIVANTYNNQNQAPVINYIDKNGNGGDSGNSDAAQGSEAGEAGNGEPGDNNDRQEAGER